MSDLLEIELPLEELEQVGRILRLCEPDERHAYSDVQLLSDGKARRWIAADRSRAAEYRGGSDGLEYDIAVPPSLLRRAAALASHETHVTLSVDSSGRRRELTLRGPGGATTVLEGVVSWKTPDRYFRDGVTWEASATLRAHHLAGAILDQPRVLRGPDDDEGVTAPNVYLEIAGGELRAHIHWAGLAPLIHVVATDQVEGQVVVPVELEILQQVLWCFEPADLVTLRLPRFNSDPVLLATDHRRAVLMPQTLDSIVLARKVEKVIEEVAGPVAAQTLPDGSYPLRTIGASIFGRLDTDSDPEVLQVYSIVLDEIDASSELLAEINELNSNLKFVRLFHRAGQVQVVADLFASSLDAEELRGALDRILDVDSRITPMLAAIYGGDAGTDPVEARWASAREATVGAWVLPVQCVDLTGPDAIVDWPLPDTVWVVSGWDPHGVEYPAEENERVNRKIAAEVAGNGGRFVDGVNRRPDGTVAKETLVMWGMDRDAARTLGSRANQDAIYEITADTVSLVSCHSDRVESWQRR